uniref:Tetraspanin n=1 Tax=Cyprinus carpio TaxID=7962 RepID=A0A8C2FC97_CYPCA
MGCFGFLKTMMFLFNGIIFLAGAAILGVGIWVKVDSGSVLSFLQNIQGAPGELGQVLNVGYLLIAVGAVLVILGFLGCCGAIRDVGALLVILGFLGCCGAIRESKCMLLLFFIIILLVFIAEVAGAIVLLVFKPLVSLYTPYLNTPLSVKNSWKYSNLLMFVLQAENLIKQVGTEVVKSIRNDYGKNPDVTGLWNTTMTSLKCCGFNNYTDFTNSYFVNDTKSYPFQCCHRVPCIEITAFNSTVPGCFPALKKLVDDNAVIIIGVALGIAALELAAMIVSMILYCKIGSERD